MTRSIEWASGLFEGEGCITTAGDRRYANWTLLLSSTDEDVVRSFHAAIGVGHVRAEPARNERCKPYWRWTAGARREVVIALEAMLPHLHSRRRARAQECLADMARRPGPERGWIDGKCPRGHAIDEPDGRTTSGRCRLCRNEAQRRRYRERKEVAS